MRCQWENGVHVDHKEFHHDQTLPRVWFSDNLPGNSKDNVDSNDARILRERIAAIPGVKACFSDKYRISLFKGRVFDWAPIQKIFQAEIEQFLQVSTQGRNAS